tara:strand:- start:470 stop:634 length:165 start_codon:yes stop_codon:yes gene_type:complete
MEKLAYGLSLLMVVYIVFLYLTVKIFGEDIFKGKRKTLSTLKEKSGHQKRKSLK